MANTPTIVAEDLHKYYGTIHALDGLSLEASERSIMAVLGTNGAGKTMVFFTTQYLEEAD